MLTGGKLMAALGIMLAALGAAQIFWVNIVDDDTPMTYSSFMWTVGVLGFLAGWLNLGSMLGKSFRRSLLMGVGAGFFAMFYVLCVGAYQEVIKGFGYNYYKDVSDVLNYFMQRFVDLAEEGADKRVLAALVIGAGSAGVFAEYFNRIWR